MLMKRMLLCAIALLAFEGQLYSADNIKIKTEFCKCNPCKCDPCMCGLKCECCKADKNCQSCSCKCTQGAQCSCASSDKACWVKNFL